MKKIKVVALFGKSGAGKDTIARMLIEYDRTGYDGTMRSYGAYPRNRYHKIISCTTRPKRAGEIEGINYHFLTHEQFVEDMMQLKFIEALEFNGWFYGTLIDDLDKDKINIGVFTPGGIRALLETADAYNLEVLPLYVRVGDKARIMRALNREKNPDVAEICRRFGTDEADFADIEFPYRNLWNDNEPTDRPYLIRTAERHIKDFFG